MATYPVEPRAAAGLALATLLLFFGALQGNALLASGCVGTVIALGVALAPVTLFLGLMTAAPHALDAPLRRWTVLDLRDTGAAVSGVLLAVALFFVLGWGGLVTATTTVEGVLGHCPSVTTTAPTGTAVLTGVTLNLAIFTLPVFLYVAFTRPGGTPAMAHALGLRSEGMLRAVAIGAASAILFIGLFAVAATLAQPYLPEQALDNDTALLIARSLTPLGALGLALASGIGEEIFFRGFLQTRIGNLATTVFFALAHFGYGSVSEVVVVFVLSLALGFLYKRTGNLWAPIAAHVVFNLVNLLVGMYAPMPE